MFLKSEYKILSLYHLSVNNYKYSLMYYCDYGIHYNGWIYIQVI